MTIIYFSLYSSIHQTNNVIIYLYLPFSRMLNAKHSIICYNKNYHYHHHHICVCGEFATFGLPIFVAGFIYFFD